MCNLSEGIAEEAWNEGMTQGMAQGMAQGEKNNMIKVIKNLWRAGKDMSIIKIASGWTEEQIMQVVQPEMN